MSVDFKSCQNLGELPVDQRLRFVFGQVLGEKEFRQEQVYFINKNRVHNRGLHGYGTVWGLGLSTDGTGDDLEVRVAPGLAVDPCGQEIEIAALQCAQLNAWLLADAVGPDGQPVLDDSGNPRRNGATLQPRGEGPAPVVVYVTLAYGECLTGEQPVFGEPCRSDSESIQATRVKDDFRLNLAATPPPHVEERLVRAFGGLLGLVELGPDTPAPTPAELDALEDGLRDAVDALPTLPAAPIVLPPSAARELLREAFRHWVVTKRPAPPPANDAVVLLGAIELTLTAAGRADEAAGLTIDDSARPYLLHTRLLQEILLNGGKGEKGDPGDPGQDGADGAPGQDGADGAPGQDGADGAPGRDGADGAPGQDGADGAPGQDGADGAPGRDGAPGPGLNQVFINANMMFGGQRPATLGLIAPASPAWNFGQAGLAVVFSWGRPNTMQRGERVALRLYWTTNIRLNTDARGTWHVGARWVRARAPGEAASNDAILEAALPDAVPGTQTIQVRGTAQRQLQVTDIFTLPPEPAAGAHFLMVEVALAEWQPGDQVATANLLLAQLDWEA